MLRGRLQETDQSMRYLRLSVFLKYVYSSRTRYPWLGMHRDSTARGSKRWHSTDGPKGMILVYSQQDPTFGNFTFCVNMKDSFRLCSELWTA